MCGQRGEGGGWESGEIVTWEGTFSSEGTVKAEARAKSSWPRGASRQGRVVGMSRRNKGDARLQGLVDYATVPTLNELGAHRRVSKWRNDLFWLGFRRMVAVECERSSAEEMEQGGNPGER